MIFIAACSDVGDLHTPLKESKLVVGEWSLCCNFEVWFA
jgi:hypothetical protein